MGTAGSELDWSLREEEEEEEEEEEFLGFGFWDCVFLGVCGKKNL